MKGAAQLANWYERSGRKTAKGDCLELKMLPLAHLIATALLVGSPPQHVARHSMAVSMLENPLANIFGGEKKKKEGGALTTGLDALLKDAPLPMKALGMLMKPLAQGLETMIAEGAADQDELLNEAQSALRADPRAASLLGDGATIDAVFSTSSSSSSVNGVTRKMIMLQAQASGPAGSGVVAIRGEADGGAVAVTSLSLQAGGQAFEVPTLRGGGGGSGDVFGGGSFGGGAPRGSSGGGNDGVIDIDVVG